MKFDLTNKTVDELEERQALLSAEIPAEEREAMTAEEIEERCDELEVIKAELEARAAAAAAAEETRQEVAEGNDPIIKDFKEEREEKPMEKNSMEYRNLWLKNLWRFNRNQNRPQLPHRQVITVSKSQRSMPKIVQTHYLAVCAIMAMQLLSKKAICSRFV